jgi:hypothetical protein
MTDSASGHRIVEGKKVSLFNDLGKRLGIYDTVDEAILKSTRLTERERNELQKRN